MTLKVFFLIILSVICCTATQVFFKKGVNSIESDSTKSIGHYVRFIGRVLITPYIWFGFITLVLWFLLWLVVLAQAELSIAFPLDSIQYLMILAASYFFLGERITWMRIVGTACIMLGIALVAVS